jgi:hypothetical protein
MRDLGRTPPLRQQRLDARDQIVVAGELGGASDGASDPMLRAAAASPVALDCHMLGIALQGDEDPIQHQARDLLAVGRTGAWACQIAGISAARAAMAPRSLALNLSGACARNCSCSLRSRISACWSGAPFFQTRAGAKQAIGRSINGFYNPIRRHSTLDYLSQVQFERLTE